MNAQEYEAFVTEILSSLECFETGEVHTNRRYDGVRQPGKYEIDIAVEISFGDVCNFLLIVECKNWQRPVDRPVVQKLAQTRDAIRKAWLLVLEEKGTAQLWPRAPGLGERR